MAESAAPTRQFVRRFFTEEFRGATITRQIPVVTAEGQRIFRRHFDGLSRSFFFTRFYGQILGGTVTEQAIKHLVERLDAADAELKKRSTLVDSLLQKHKLKPSFKNGVPRTAVIIDPLANRVANSIVEADRIVQCFYALWLGCILDDKQFRRANDELTAIIRGIHQNAMEMARAVQHQVYENRAQRDESEEDRMDEIPVATESAAIENPSDVTGDVHSGPVSTMTGDVEEEKEPVAKRKRTPVAASAEQDDSSVDADTVPAMATA